MIAVKCRHCGSTDVKKNGKAKTGKQRYICSNPECEKKTFIIDYTYNAHDPKVRSQIFWSVVNGSGTRATARTLKIAKGTVTEVLRSVKENLWYVNYDYIEKHKSEEISIDFVLADEVEMDEMWSFYHDKKHQIWLWWAIDHSTGEPLAFCFGTREHKYLDELSGLLKPFYINIVYSDDNFAYKKRIDNNVTGKENTQKIERKHLSLRTWCSRLVRKGIRFSKDKDMHIIVVALIINFWFFNRIVW